jgi:hypothetical protein
MIFNNMKVIMIQIRRKIIISTTQMLKTKKTYLVLVFKKIMWFFVNLLSIEKLILR